MSHRRRGAGLAVGLLALASVVLTPGPDDPAAAPSAPYAWALPPGFPQPFVPADNPMSAAKVRLGRHLFFDPRLSGNGTQSCASCHQPARAFTDGRARALGSTGDEHPRASMSLANVAYAATLTWASRRLTRLEDQATVPMFNRHPVELGLEGDGSAAWARLSADPRYRPMIAAAFPGEVDLDLDRVTQALASFQRTLISGRAPFDRLVFDDDREALDEEARAGMRLFFSDRLACSQCHGGPAFAGPQVTASGPREVAPTFHRTGVGAPSGRDQGLQAESERPEDSGRFRAPTLRNLSVTAPYMHDGSLATLDEVLDHYAAGGGPGASELLTGFELTPGERTQLKAFLASLDDPEFLADPRHQDPW